MTIKKTYQATLKDLSPEGRGKAVFATLDVIDKDGDVILKGAFPSQIVKLQAAHDTKSPNIGYAKIYEQGNEAIAEFQFYLDMPSAKEWYTAIKNNYDNGVFQEYSYGFSVVQSERGQKDGKPVRFIKEQIVYEVSPVMVGAGVNTRTVAIKEKQTDDAVIDPAALADPDKLRKDFEEALNSSISGVRAKWGHVFDVEMKDAVPSHKTSTTDVAWDASAVVKRVKEDQAASYYRKIYAWQNPDKDPMTKGAWSFPHHEVDVNGNPGAAVMRAASAGIGVLNGARGNSGPWAKDREGIYRHLARHLKDGGKDVPELKSIEEIEAKAKEEQKAYVQVQGSWEQMQDRIREAGEEMWGGNAHVCLEATFATTAVFTIMPYGAMGMPDCTYLEADWAEDETGAIGLSNEREVVLEAIIGQKNHRFSEDHATLLRVNQHFLVRSKALTALRQKEGRALSRANRDRIHATMDELDRLKSQLASLLESADPQPTDGGKSIDLDSLYLNSLEVRARVAGNLSNSKEPASA